MAEMYLAYYHPLHVPTLATLLQSSTIHRTLFNDENLHYRIDQHSSNEPHGAEHLKCGQCNLEIEFLILFNFSCYI